MNIKIRGSEFNFFVSIFQKLKETFKNLFSTYYFSYVGGYIAAVRGGNYLPELRN